jgi:hypothetical protein
VATPLAAQVLSSYAVPANLIGLSVAGLPLWLDARGSGVDMALSVCHTKFVAPGRPHGGLVLQVQDGQLPGTDGWQPIYHSFPASELWLDRRGHYVFVASEFTPPKRHVVLDAGFTRGEVLGEFSSGANAGQALYPLQDLDMMFFANWLAGYGDLILHASGVNLAGAGYGFVGVSGAGKSTLAATLASDGSATVLGEDQVILRYVGGRFWIFGTPWHLNPEMCSPLGVPLHKLFFLDRAAGDGVAPCAPVDGIARLLQTAFVPYYRSEAVAAILDRLALLAERVPFYTLSYRLGEDVMGLVQEA